MRETVIKYGYMICLECGTTTDKEICERDGCPTVDGQEFGQNGDPLVGALFTEKYRCISLLGRGGMGRVYKAWQRDLNRVVALKVISDEISSNEAAVRRFMREVRVTSQLNHPNSIRIFDFGYTEGRRIFFSMEFLVGRSLFRAIQAREQFDDLRVIHVASQVLKSLGEAHRKGIIHRDLTPDNIFLVPVTGDRDFVKVLDFGVAKAKGGWATGSGLTAEGYLIGKPKYVSPEQIEHEEEIDGRSDLYSLGIVMYEMICGAAPFVSATPLKTVLQHVNEPPPDIREKARRPVGRELAGFVMRLLEKDREKRPASAETALNLLQEIEKEMSGAPGREADKTRFHPGYFALSVLIAAAAIVLYFGYGIVAGDGPRRTAAALNRADFKIPEITPAITAPEPQEKTGMEENMPEPKPGKKTPPSKKDGSTKKEKKPDRQVKPDEKPVWRF